MPVDRRQGKFTWNSTIKKFIINAATSTNLSINEVAVKITHAGLGLTDYEKSQLIYAWIAHHIFYDCELATEMKSESMSSQYFINKPMLQSKISPETVIIKRITVAQCRKIF